MLTAVVDDRGLVGLGFDSRLPDADLLPPLHVQVGLSDQLQVHDLQLNGLLGPVRVELWKEEPAEHHVPQSDHAEVRVAW